MFGHLDINFGRDRDFRRYQCSLCHALAADYGSMARFLTNYDIALCLLIASGAGARNIIVRKKVCPAFSINETLNQQHPLLKYLSAITILLVSEKVKDDIYDEKRHYPAFAEKWLEKRRKKADKILAQLGFDPLLIERTFEIQRLLESKEKIDLLQVSEPTAYIMSEIYTFTALVNKTPESEETLRQIGYHLGRIIYILDSLIDYSHDMHRNAFNPLQRCFASTKEITENIPQEAKVQSYLLLNTALSNLQRLLRDLPGSFGLINALPERIRRKIESAMALPSYPVKEQEHTIWKLRRMTPLSLLSLPDMALASNGREGGNACYESITFLIIMLVAYAVICRGCCGRGCSSQPDKVTVDHGCGGRKTYRRDSCTGRYRDDGCC
jgi:hypothetical protein